MAVFRYDALTGYNLLLSQDYRNRNRNGLA